MVSVNARTVVSFGAHIVDILGRPVTEIPAGQGHQLLEQIRMTVAGTAAGTSVDLAKLGIPVRALGAIGCDDLGDFVLTTLRRYGVSTAGLARLAGVQTASSILPIRPNGDRPALAVRGANAAMCSTDLDLTRLNGAALLHIGAPDVLANLSSDDLAQITARAKAHGAIVTLDVLTSGGNDALERLAPMLAYVNYFMPNEEQLLGFANESDLERAARRFLTLGVQAVLVSRGADGLSVIDGYGRTDLPAYSAEVVDTTGCGDAVSAGVIAGLINGWPLLDAARLGLAAASLVAGGLGSDAGIVDFATTARIAIPDISQAQRARIESSAESTAGPVLTRPSPDSLGGLDYEADGVQLPTYAELPRLGDMGSSWGLWGEEDRLGCLNLLGRAQVQAAACEINTGKVFPLSLTTTLPHLPVSGRSEFVRIAEYEDGISDTEHVELDDPSARNTRRGSQWVGLRRVSPTGYGCFGGLLRDAHGIDHWSRRGIVGRAVLLDVARWREIAGRPIRHEVSDLITADDITACVAAQRVSIEVGDILLIRTGWRAWYSHLDQTKRHALGDSDQIVSAGLDTTEEMAALLWNFHISALAADNPALEAWPPRPHDSGELHTLQTRLVAMLGLPIGEMFGLDELAEHCAVAGTYYAFMTSAPLNLTGGIGSPPNAIVVA